jgi:hypothetical protein
LRLWLGAIVEDEVLIDGTDGERRNKYGDGVGRRDSAAFLARRIEIWMPESMLSNVQGAVVVKYAEDLYTDLALRVFEV